MPGARNHSFDPNTFHAKYGGVTVYKCAENHLVYAQGDAADAVFYLQQGWITRTVVSDQGKERVIGILGAGDFCGEACLADQVMRVSTATTMTECLIVRLQKAAVARALHEDLLFSEFFVSYLLSRNVRLNDDLLDKLFNSSERRLARVLLLLANYEKNQRKRRLAPHINQQTLAKMIGTTRPRVNHFMNKFRRLGYIDYNGHIEVHLSLLGVVLHDPSESES